MSDDIEKRLRKYRPADPPLALRARIVSAPSRRTLTRSRTPVRTLWRWLPAAAAAIAALTFHVMSASLRNDLQASWPAQEQERQAVLANAAAALGGDEQAWTSAERMIALQDPLTDDDPGVGAPAAVADPAIAGDPFDGAVR